MSNSNQDNVSEDESSEDFTEVDSISEGTSSSGSSSDEENEEQDSEAAGGNLLNGEEDFQPRPITKRAKVDADLKSRLSSFLSQMKAANEELAESSASKQLDNVGDDEQRYIEMDLNLGVLSEIKADNRVKTTEGDSSESSEDELAPVKESERQNLHSTENSNTGIKRKIEELS